MPSVDNVLALTDLETAFEIADAAFAAGAPPSCRDPFANACHDVFTSATSS